MSMSPVLRGLGGPCTGLVVVVDAKFAGVEADGIKSSRFFFVGCCAKAARDEIRQIKKIVFNAGSSTLLETKFTVERQGLPAEDDRSSHNDMRNHELLLLGSKV